ncbi:MAG TPA: LamG-like jellyroll fold domain-containing protein, partial [Verrucomicrobiae bacterium]|nr:LamG-like jellyroll fold domain-containing protein [Verrucomicrobiae bacterium]
MKIHHPLKSLIGPLAVAALALPAISQAQPFNPVPLKQSSYTFSIVVPQSAVAPVPACVNAFVGSGQTLSDNTFYEQGLYTPIPGDTYYNSGVPFHNTVFTSINDANMTFLMPPTYLTNNDLMIVNGQYGYLPTGALTFNTPTTATSLEVLDSGGNGGCTVGWTVTYQNGNTQSGTLSVPDWFNGGSSVAWGCNGREDENGDLNNLNGSTQNNQVPYLYSTLISGLSSSSPVASVTFNYSSGSGVDNFFAVSASTDGTHYTPVPVSGFNVMALIPNTTPYPVTATMDNGTNLSNPGNTWFESGYYAADSSYGLPPSGSTFTSFSQPSHTYQMGNYSTNDATLIDADHLSANITPATPGAYTALAFLTAGGNIGGGNVMTNICIIQHADGVNETNLFFGYDWFNQSLPNAIAWESNGRVDMNSRSLNSIGNQGLPFLFETYFVLSDAGSAVTNIEVQYDTAPAGNSTTFIMAVSAATGAVLPIITQEPTPATQTWFVGQTATISVEVSGIAPLTNTWLVESNGIYVPLANGTDVNGSVVSGATTPTLSISDLTLLDSTNYEYIASNAGGTEPATTTASITVRSAGTAGLVPIANWNNIANETYPLGSTINIFSGGGPSQALATLTLSGGQVHNGWSSDGGTNGNGGNTSLMNGLLDAGNYGGSPAIATIGGLDNSTTYNVYIYDFSDTSRPSDGTDGLPDYTVNGTIYYMPVLGALTPSYWNEQDVAVGGTNFAGTGFVEGTPQATNDIGTFSYNTVSASSFGDYLEIPNVSPVNGAITIEPEADGTTYRSPFNGFELVPATGPSFGIHFLGNTADPVAIAPLPPVIQYETPSGLVNVPTNHAARMPLSVTVDEGSTAPLAYQWYGIVSGTTQAVAGATSANLTIVTTNTEAYYCVVTNFVGAATSAPVTINVFTPATPSPYVAELLALHPVAYWPLNETNGTVAFDYAGTNNGTYEGSYQLGEPGLPYANGVGTNTSAYFNGSSGYVDIPSGGANWNLNITGPMTAVEWVEVPAGGEPNFGCSLGHSDQSYRFVVNGTGNQPRWDDSGPDAYNGSFGITSQAWHQLVGIYDGSHEYLYVDNNLIDTESESSPPGGSLDDLNIAQAPDYAGSRNFEGNLAQVAIYNYALSVSQLQSLYASLDTAPLVSVTPATAAVASGNSVTFTASLAGTPATSLQWYVVVGTATNSIEGATNSMYTVTAPPLSDNGNIYAIMAANAYGTNFASATLTVTSA